LFDTADFRAMRALIEAASSVAAFSRHRAMLEIQKRRRIPAPASQAMISNHGIA
jgi:hypothetical protein